MNDERLQTIEQVKQFLAGSETLDFGGVSVEERYQWIQTVLVKFKYYQLKRAEKGVIRRYIEKVSGYSRAQVSRLIRVYTQRGQLRKACYKRHRFSRRYTTADIALLARTDELHDYLSGPATKKIMEREWELYGHSDFRNISRISIAHLYNMRRSHLYRSITTRYTRTKPSVVKIAERAKPEPGGSPGHIRTDTVHQGDLNGKKGVYHINAVDEITQWEIIASVERISESYLMPVLESMLGGFPFVIKGFHSDNGSEFINKVVAELLNKLLIRFTKSRPRHTNDNGLVESKNGSVVRKHLGYAYISQACAEALNRYNSDFLNPYINFHRPCFFPVSVTDHRGKIKKRYPYQEVMTPYEKFKSLPAAEGYLRPGVTMAKLDDIASQMSDNEFAERMVKARSNLFQNISRGEQRVAVG
ncbi:MAG: integrase, partial [Dehalococcoidia bacterium]|nr:integrase [Dehalococcoidia bacterium]